MDRKLFEWSRATENGKPVIQFTNKKNEEKIIDEKKQEKIIVQNKTEDIPVISNIKINTCMITGFYTDTNNARTSELRECLAKNLDNPIISEMHIFLEDCTAENAIKNSTLLLSNKITMIEIGRRILFKDIFSYANNFLKGKIVILSNADVYFDNTLNMLSQYNFNNLLICLTRTELSGRIETSGYSQDAWIFVPPIKEFKCDWQMGKLACDSHLSYRANEAGIKLINPCKSIKVWHRHGSMIRHYSQEDAVNGELFLVEQT